MLASRPAGRDQSWDPGIVGNLEYHLTFFEQFISDIMIDSGSEETYSTQDQSALNALHYLLRSFDPHNLPAGSAEQPRQAQIDEHLAGLSEDISPDYGVAIASYRLLMPDALIRLVEAILNTASADAIATERQKRIRRYRKNLLSRVAANDKEAPEDENPRGELCETIMISLY